MSSLATQVVLRALSAETAFPRRLEEVSERAAAADGVDVTELRMERTVLAALAGRHDEAETALHELRSGAPRRLAAEAELIAALVMLEAGYSARAAGSLERLDAKGDLGAWAGILAGLLRAQALRLDEAALEALEVSTAALQRAEAEDAPAELRCYAHLVVADAALSLADPELAERHIDGAAQTAGRTGLLAARASQLRASVRMAARPADAAGATAPLRAAISRLERLEAPRHLGMALLLMADVSAVNDEVDEAPALWLARARTQLLAAGTPQDLVRLRWAFRAYGRRAHDRVLDVKLSESVEDFRAKAARLRDLMRSQADIRAEVGGRPDEGDEATLEFLREAYQAGETVITALEGVASDREQTGRLASVNQGLATLDDLDAIRTAVPSLALWLCSAESAELYAVEADGTLDLRARAGEPTTIERDVLQDRARKAISSGQLQILDADRQPEIDRDEADVLGRAVMVPIGGAGRPLVLAIERRPPKGRLRKRDAERIEVYASLATSCISRATSRMALREAAARDAATLEAIRDGVISLDASGRVTALNRAGASLLRVSEEELLGRRLDELPALGPLAEVLREGGGTTEDLVTLAQGELMVRAHPHEAGVVAVLQAVATAQRIAGKVVAGSARFTFDDLIGEDPVFQRCLRDARHAARSDVPILITGESGTGKEMLAQSIHARSARAGAPFVGVNVAALPRELIESELFGYVQGAFTGASSRGKPGKFELAGQGTLLLDEIGDLSLDLQAKLLRVLQERVVQPLGGTTEVPILARVVASTHRDLDRAVDEGSFRLDLFHRLRVVHLHLPPLRERQGDIPALVEHHLRMYSARHARPPIEVAQSVMEALSSYSWPGNVRELANAVEGEASLLAPGERVITRVPAVLTRVTISGPRSGVSGSIPPLSEVERELLTRALAHYRGNIAQVATALGVSRGTVYNKMKRHRLTR